MNEMIQLKTHVINQNGSIMNMIVVIVKTHLKLKAQSPKVAIWRATLCIMWTILEKQKRHLMEWNLHDI